MMKKTYLIYSLLIGLCCALIMQSCSKQNELEDYGKVPPTLQITTPTTGLEINRNRIDHTVTVTGTVTGTSLKSLSYVLNDGTVVEVPDFDGSSPDFTFDLDFAAMDEGDSEDVSLTVTVKDESGEEASQTVTFKVNMNAYAIPVIE